MVDETDEELERIRREKLRELMTLRKTGSTSNQRDLATPIKVTDATLTEVLRNHPLVVVDCWAPWCFPCNIVAPVIEELARDYAGKIVFGKLNVDENQRTSREYGIMGIPTLLIFKNGRLIDTVVGAKPRQTLEPLITKYLN